jgi:hypothetical protein
VDEPPTVVRNSQYMGSSPFSPTRVPIDLSTDTPSPARPAKRPPSGCLSASADDHRRVDTKDSPRRVRKQVSHRQHCPLHAVFRYVVRYPAADALSRANTHAPAALRLHNLPPPPLSVR